MTVEIDYDALLNPGLPPPAPRWTGFPRYNFVGGHNDADSVPVEAMIAAMTAALEREGRNLATYNMRGGPRGYPPLREFVAGKLAKRSGMAVTIDNVLITSGSQQGLDLANDILCRPGDTVAVEEFSYGGALARLRRIGVEPVGVPTDSHGMRMDGLAGTLAALKARGATPKYIYTIPTVQNPGGGILPEERRREMLRLSAEYGVPILEDECYADLLWDGARPPAIAALDEGNRTIHVGSFSKTIAPALRVGYVAAPEPLVARLVACKTDGGTGALEQLMLAEYCAGGFDGHVDALCRTLKGKLDALVAAVAEEFGASAEFEAPKGGIYLWITLPDNVDALELARVAAAEGVALNPGPEWAADPASARSRLRLCFGHPSPEDIREGVRRLAEICHREFGVPVRGGNVARG